MATDVMAPLKLFELVRDPQVTMATERHGSVEAQAPS